VRVAIIGCGLIGRKRARALGEHRLVVCADRVLKLAESLASEYPGCVAVDDPRQAIERPDVDAVIVATTNNALASVGLLAAEAGKHVLIEKPAGRNAEEIRPILAAAERAGVIAKVGFNHRFHPSFQKARQLVDAGAIGELMFIRGRYGHGGRAGYEREWRADPAIAGGGELLDQGVHVIDLARWFLGDFVDVSGHVANFFWQMPVEDNGFMMLKTAGGQVAWLHVSCTEWKNLFSFEIYGRDGKLQIDGLGGSYGTERLTYYRMLPEMGPPETSAWEYPREDRSWDVELQHWLACIEAGREPDGSLRDGLAAMEIIERLYRDAGRVYQA
jgi:predicted dehydrogenase